MRRVGVRAVVAWLVEDLGEGGHGDGGDGVMGRGVCVRVILQVDEYK